MRKEYCLALVVVLASGCSGKTIDAGYDPDGGGNDAGGSSPGAVNPAPVAVSPGASGPGSDGCPAFAAQPTSGIQTFKGYIENFTFPSGSDTVVMNLATATDGTVTGNVFFGDGPPLAPPTNPDVGYPPAEAEAGAADILDLGGALEDFSFTVEQGKNASSRVTFDLYRWEMWNTWCTIQTTIYPIYNGGVVDGGLIGYNCLPNDGFTATSSNSCTLLPLQPQQPPIPVDCGKLTLCHGLPVCSCTPTSCWATCKGGAGQQVHFDMQLANGTLSGSVAGLSSNIYNVHLTNQ
jgi:hypothetical protein